MALFTPALIYDLLANCIIMSLILTTLSNDKNFGTVDAMVHEEIHIEDNATGYSYEKVFCKCFDALLTKVEVEDPYIRNNHQVKL